MDDLEGRDELFDLERVRWDQLQRLLNGFFAGLISRAPAGSAPLVNEAPATRAIEARKLAGEPLPYTSYLASTERQIQLELYRIRKGAEKTF